MKDNKFLRILLSILMIVLVIVMLIGLCTAVVWMLMDSRHYYGPPIIDHNVIITEELSHA